MLREIGFGPSARNMQRRRSGNRSRPETMKKLAKDWIYDFQFLFFFWFSYSLGGTYFRTYFVSSLGPKAKTYFLAGRLDRNPGQKNPRVRKIRVRNSGAGNGCANFMDAWKNALFPQEKPMSIKFLLLGGGYFGFWGGGECRF